MMRQILRAFRSLLSPPAVLNLPLDVEIERRHAIQVHESGGRAIKRVIKRTEANTAVTRALLDSVRER